MRCVNNPHIQCDCDINSGLQCTPTSDAMRADSDWLSRQQQQQVWAAAGVGGRARSMLDPDGYAPDLPGVLDDGMDGRPAFDGPDPHDSPLRQWWTDTAMDEAERTIAKMEEYGSLDLVHIGRAIWDMCGRTSRLTDAAAMELGVLFYLYGKIQRAMSAAKADRPVSDDTWFDMHVYAKMAEAARAGVWPL